MTCNGGRRKRFFRRQLQTRLKTLFARLEAIAEAGALSDRLCAHLAKAKRLTHRLVATLSFFFMMVNTPACTDSHRRSSGHAQRPDPGALFERAAARSTDAEQRHRLRALSAQRLAPLRQPSHPIQSLDRETRRYLEQVAGECADLFQRSSTPVSRGATAFSRSISMDTTV